MPRTIQRLPRAAEAAEPVFAISNPFAVLPDENDEQPPADNAQNAATDSIAAAITETNTTDANSRQLERATAFAAAMAVLQESQSAAAENRAVVLAQNAAFSRHHLPVGREELSEYSHYKPVKQLLYHWDEPTWYHRYNAEWRVNHMLKTRGWTVTYGGNHKDASRTVTEYGAKVRVPQRVTISISSSDFRFWKKVYDNLKAQEVTVAYVHLV